MICFNTINTECREVQPALYLAFCGMVRRWDPCSSFGIAYFSGPSGLLRQLETWPRRRLWWPIKRPHWSPEMLWVLARRFAWYQTTHLVQDVPACLRHWLGWLWFWLLCIFNLNNLALATSLLLMRNYVTGVGVESAWHAWDWVSTGVVVVPGPSAAVSCQSPEVNYINQSNDILRNNSPTHNNYALYFWRQKSL